MSIGGRGRYYASMWNGGGSRCLLRGGDRLGDLRHVQKDWLGMLIAIHEWVDETLCSSFRLLVYHWYPHRYSKRAFKAHKQFLNEYFTKFRPCHAQPPYQNRNIAQVTHSIRAYTIRRHQVPRPPLEAYSRPFPFLFTPPPLISSEPSHLPLMLMQRL